MLEYPHVNQEIKLTVTIDSKIIILEDGSKWETSPLRNSNGVSFWFENALVRITPGRHNKMITYHLKNLDDNDTVQGVFLGFVDPPKNI